MPSDNAKPSSSLSTWNDAEVLLRERRFADAQAAYQALLADPQWQLPAHMRLSVVALEQGDLRESVAQALAAFQARDTDTPAVLLEALCKLLVDNGELQAALECSREPALVQASDPAIQAGIGKLLGQQSFPGLATQLLQRARQLGLDASGLDHLLGRVAMYAGQTDLAQRELEACLRRDPDNAAAWRDLARLRRQTTDDNHVDALRAAIARGGDKNTAPLLHYALFKELDDLGDTEAAWQALEQGMRLRRSQVSHDPAAEQALFEYLQTNRGDAQVGEMPGQGPQPIFIVGMPRSGTTLLERILGAHAQVTDAGELRDFNWQLRWMCNHPGTPHLDLALARAAEGIDWAHLGQRYLSHTQWHADGRDFYTDKLPANFVHVGHIARALPGARILHMRRAPMDSCFSNLKELFADAYPHSYDQVEMADHYLRYRRLMAHWHAQFPGRILDVEYEDLAGEPERVARQVLAFCGLPWQADVLAVESRAGSVATASTTQVREPIHQRFVGQWKRYERYLQPLRERLERLEP